MLAINYRLVKHVIATLLCLEFANKVLIFVVLKQ